ncbi:hypothetical protein SB2_13540 [Methylobacterium radiotolerans]|nr:hypothetical protein SB3_24345 [Methylobacterium radiotolerans]KTS47314.1 hypothetical protein SB2_13540 [Methylobacterium radiotolerans]
MTGRLDPAATLESIRRNLVGLKMARALEVLDQTLRQIEQGQIGAVEAIDVLLTEELTLLSTGAEVSAIMGFQNSLPGGFDGDR